MKCPNCGSVDFLVSEFIVYSASVDDDNVLTTHSIKENGVDLVSCRSCGTDVNQDNFKEINFT